MTSQPNGGAALWWRRAVPAVAAVALLLLAVPLLVGGSGSTGTGLPPSPAPRVADRGPVRAGAGFFPLRPTSLLAGASIEPGRVRRFRVAGTPAGVPGEGVTAVALNIELAVGARAATATVLPAGTEAPAGQVTVAAGPGRAASAFAIQQLPAGGELDVLGGGDGPATVTVRIRGYYAAPCGDDGATWRPVQPATLLDTTVPAGGSVPTAPGGVAGGPPDAHATAVTLAVQASQAGGPGRLQIHPFGAAAPDDATLAFAPGRDASVLDVVRPAPDGRLAVTNRSGTPVRVKLQVVGLHIRGPNPDRIGFQAMEPSLLLDTMVRAGSPVPLRVAGVAGLPAIDPGRGVAPTPQLALVGLGPTADARLIVAGAPGGATAAAIELRRGEAAAGRVVPSPGRDGQVWLSVSAGSVRVLAWVHGWFGPPPRLTAAPDRATFVAFDRRGATKPGWTRGSVSSPVTLPGGGTAWLFAEAFLGILRPDGSQPPWAPGPPRGKGPVSALVHNSIVIRDSGKLTTYSGPVDKATGYPDALLRPPGAGGDRWYWPSGGLVEGGALRVFVHEFGQQPDGTAAWTGHNRLVSLALPGMTELADTPLPGADQGSRAQWGAAVLEEATHTYVYGTEDTPGSLVKHSHVARFPRGVATGSWEFWDGSGWSPDPAASAPLAGPGGSDPVTATVGTVARVNAGYVLLSIADFGATIDVRTGCSPTGPWGATHQLYQIPELRSAKRQGDYALLARGHPDGGGLLVAYSLNASDPSQLVNDASYYRPRYVTVR